jgi:serine/threonine-protein kinase
MGAEHTVAPGDVLAGKYRVERLLGSGGMGVVLMAHHIQLDEKVALKVPLPGALSAEDVARFMREARAAVKIKNEHVARVLDVGRLENGVPYIVMEYLEGQDLSAWIEQRGPMPFAQAVDFLLQSCEAIANAHALGIVHRDLKPGNLFCTQRSDGRYSIKVLDFGISKVATPEGRGHQLTATSTLMGSPLYMSPEQMQRSKGVDARTDIWSLGVILFQLLTGRPPFAAEALTELAIKVANEPAPPLRAHRPEAPEGLDRVIARCLEKDRSQRFQTVGELAVALREFGSEQAPASVERILGTLRNAGAMRGELAAEESALSATVPSPAAGKTPPRMESSWVEAAPVSSTHPRRTLRAGAVASISVAVGLVVFLVAVGARYGAWNAAQTASPASMAIEAAPSAGPPPSVAMVPSEGADSAPVAASVVTVPPPRVSSPAMASDAAAPQAIPAGPQRKRVDCDPPYTVNAKGSRIYKKECL